MTRFMINEQAAAWLAEFAMSPLSEQRWHELTRWLDSDPRHIEAFLRMARASNALDLLARLGLGEPSAARPCAVPSSGWECRKFYRPAGVAAAVVAVATGVLVWMWSVSWQSYESSRDAVKKVTLSDGSVVMLNMSSRLRVRLTVERREVELLRGEALFDVTASPNRPFEVRTPNEVARALGTRFSVRLGRGREVDTIVAQGQVQVFAEGTQPVLNAGQMASGAPEKVSVDTLGADVVERKLAWTKGGLSFSGETLAEVVAEFNRYNRVKLVVKDPRLAQLQIGGYFSENDIDAFCQQLYRIYGVRASEVIDPDSPDDGIVYLTAGSSGVHDSK
jgi:transmembrane sensor